MWFTKKDPLSKWCNASIGKFEAVEIIDKFTLISRVKCLPFSMWRIRLWLPRLTVSYFIECLQIHSVWLKQSVLIDIVHCFALVWVFFPYTQVNISENASILSWSVLFKSLIVRLTFIKSVIESISFLIRTVVLIWFLYFWLACALIRSWHIDSSILYFKQ